MSPDRAAPTDRAASPDRAAPADRATRPGGRTARVRAAVRAATLAELAERGYQGLTVEAVAERSGVHKTTVYRRWGSVEGLIADALELAGGEPWPVPDTGDLAGDLRALTREVLVGFTDPESGPVATAFVSAAVQNPAAARALHAFFAARHEQAAPLVSRAVRRGEVPADTDPAEVVRVAVAPLYYRLFVSGEPIDAAVAERAADAALTAARAGVLRTTPPPGAPAPGAPAPHEPAPHEPTPGAPAPDTPAPGAPTSNGPGPDAPAPGAARDQTPAG